MFGISSQINSKSHYTVMLDILGAEGVLYIVEMSQLKIMTIVSCFIRLTALYIFLFITVEVTTQPQHTNAHSG